MVFWQRKGVSRPLVSTLRSKATPREFTRVDFAELIPAPLPFVGKVMRTQLGFFGLMAQAAQAAPTFDAKERLAIAAGSVLFKYQRIAEVLGNVDGANVPEIFTPQTHRLAAKYSDISWDERLLGVHITLGMLDDFFIAVAGGLPVNLAGGLPVNLRNRVQDILSDRKTAEILVNELTSVISDYPERVDCLALWGRSLVGDTLLVARKVLIDVEEAAGGAEPVFTALIAEHTRRMDALGLTA